MVNDKYAKKEVKSKVIRADQLIRFIKEQEQNSKEFASSMKEMTDCAQSYLDSNVEERPEYIQKFEELVNEVGTSKNPSSEEAVKTETEAPLPETDLKCPRCGSPLVLRTAKKGDNAGNQFYGCSAFPKCRYIQNI